LTPPAGSTYLSDLSWTSMTNGWGPVEKDTSNGGQGAGDGRTITLNGITYTKGLGAHAASDVRYYLGGGCTRFRSDVGVDDEVTARGTVVFQVYADGVKLYDSGTMTVSSTTKVVDVDLTNKTELRLVVTDSGDGIDSDHADWAAARIDCGQTGNVAPVPQIDSPPATTTWTVGDVISFSGSASDSEDGSLPASALSWKLILHHCPDTCHVHVIQTYDGVSNGSFTAPDHEYPSHLELQLTATDSGGLQATTSVLLYPQTVSLTFATSPSGLQLVVNGTGGVAPFARTVITGSTNTISAVTPQTANGVNYAFSSWSDGGAQSHNLTANASATYTATYSELPTAPSNTALPTISGQAKEGGTLTADPGTWAGSKPISFQYQWLRCDKFGGNCAAFTSATAKTYVPTSNDVGSRLKVLVTGTNAVGSSSALSAATAQVKRAR
jgi:hypothetical protein